jgi:hypothetical protein
MNADERGEDKKTVSVLSAFIGVPLRLELFWAERSLVQQAG